MPDPHAELGVVLFFSYDYISPLILEEVLPDSHIKPTLERCALPTFRFNFCNQRNTCMRLTLPAAQILKNGRHPLKDRIGLLNFCSMLSE